MPIKVTCACGASFSAKDELAGRTVACPKCRQPLQVPHATGAATQPSSAGSTSAPATQANPAAAAKPAAATSSAPGAKSAAKPAAPQAAAKPAAPVQPTAVPQLAATSASPTADLFDEVGLKAVAGPRCPKCSEPLNPNAVLCVKCGFHIQTGEKLAAAKVQTRGEGGHAAVSETLLKRAAERIEDERMEEKKKRAQGAPTYIIFFAFAAVIAFAATMLSLPRDQAFRVCGTGIAVFGYCMITYYSIRMVISAFFESAACGLLYLFVPFYALYYLITRWQRVGGFFLMSLVGTGVVMFGMGMIAVAPYMAIKEEGESAYIPPAAVESHGVA